MGELVGDFTSQFGSLFGIPKSVGELERDFPSQLRIVQASWKFQKSFVAGVGDSQVSLGVNWDFPSHLGS